MNKKTSMDAVDFKKIILDILFPIFCIGCRKEGQWICDDCFSKINLLSAQLCPICERKATKRGGLCDGCFKKDEFMPIKSLLLGTEYGQIDKATHLLKYNFVEDLSMILGNILARSFIKNDMPIPDLIIPVPIHQRRLRMRGFNQSELLARFLSENIAPGIMIPVSSNIIFRKKHTSPQMKIKNYQERRKNIKDAFSIHENSVNEIKDKRILLVDDIVTTGATVSECAKTILKRGAKEVRVIALARQKMK